MDSMLMIDRDKLKVILSICEYLSKEIKNCSSDESQESLIVALQCIEAGYNISHDKLRTTMNIPDLWSALNSRVSETGPDPEILKNRGNELMAAEHYHRAVDSYSKAIEINPKNAVYYCNRAAAYCRMGKFLESIDDCKTAVRLDPNYSKAYGRLGLAYLNLNLFGEAVNAYNTALQLDPSNDVYKQNFEIAMDRYRCTTCSSGNSASASAPRNFFTEMISSPNVQAAITQIVNNPNLINLATEMLSDESLQNVGQQLAQQMQDQNPGFLDDLRRQFITDDTAPETSNNTNNNQNPNNKDDTPSDPQDDD